MALNNIHIIYLKQFIDQLIINKGIIKIDNPERIVDKIKMDYLVKLAFRFYSKLYNSEKYASYLKIGEYDSPAAADADYQPVFQNILTQLNSTKSDTVVQCLNCGVEIHTKDLQNLGTDLPVCSKCYKDIGIEFDIWQKVFDD